ncbi:TPA: hypothetical protein ACGO1T_001022 [Streptococcus suis]
MRTNARATFIEIATPESLRYDPETGEYVKSEVNRVEKPCHLSDLGISNSIQLFGTQYEDAKVIRLDQPYTKPFNYIELNGFYYAVIDVKLSGLVFYIRRADKVGDRLENRD